MLGVSFVVGSYSEDNPEYLSEGQYPTTSTTGKQPIDHSDRNPCSRFCSCLNAVKESRSENMGLYRYDQMVGCLPDGSMH